MKKLFAPEETQELLRGWQIHANKGRDKHELAAQRLESRYRQIGVASIIFSAICLPPLKLIWTLGSTLLAVLLVFLPLFFPA